MRKIDNRSAFHKWRVKLFFFAFDLRRLKRERQRFLPHKPYATE